MFEIVDQDRARVTVERHGIPALILHLLVALPIAGALPVCILVLSETIRSYSALSRLTAGIAVGVPYLAFLRYNVRAAAELVNDRIIEIRPRSGVLSVKTAGRPFQVPLSDISCVHVGSHGRYSDLYNSDVFIVLKNRRRSIPTLRFRRLTANSEESARKDLETMAAWLANVAACEIGEPRRVTFIDVS
jgi:hypothetical protein